MRGTERRNERKEIKEEMSEITNEEKRKLPKE